MFVSGNSRRNGCLDRPTDHALADTMTHREGSAWTADAPCSERQGTSCGGHGRRSHIRCPRENRADFPPAPPPRNDGDDSVNGGRVRFGAILRLRLAPRPQPSTVALHRGGSSLTGWPPFSVAPPPMAKRPPKNPVTKPAPLGMAPGRNGGWLRVGGTNKGGTGRPPKLIRAGLREAIPVEVAKLAENVVRIEQLVADFDAIDRSGQASAVGEAAIEREESRIRQRMTLQERLIAARVELLTYCGKYGLGTTFTETDDDGNAVPIGRLSPDEQRAEVLRILAERN